MARQRALDTNGSANEESDMIPPHSNGHGEIARFFLGDRGPGRRFPSAPIAYFHMFSQLHVSFPGGNPCPVHYQSHDVAKT